MTQDNILNDVTDPNRFVSVNCIEPDERLTYDRERKIWTHSGRDEFGVWSDEITTENLKERFEKELQGLYRMLGQILLVGK